MTDQLEAESIDPTNVLEAVPFFHVSSMEASLKFYVDGLGWKVARQWAPDGSIRWCRLEQGGAALMLQDFRTDDGSVRTPEGKLGVGVSVSFTCKDALTMYRRACSRGLDAPEPMVSNGLWTTSLRDPDGYRVDFASATDAAEETTLSEWEHAKE